MWACYVYSVVFSPAAQPDHSRLQAPPGAVHEQNGAETRLDYVRREREGPRRMVGEGSRHCLRWLTLPYSESRRGVVLGSWYRFCQDLIWPPQTTRRGHRGGGAQESVSGWYGHGQNRPGASSLRDAQASVCRTAGTGTARVLTCGQLWLGLSWFA